MYDESLVDTGAGVVGASVRDKRLLPMLYTLVLKMANGQRLLVEGEVTLPVELGDHTIHHRFFVADVGWE